MTEGLRQHAVLAVAALLAVGPVATGRIAAGQISSAEDWRLLSTLFALLLSVEMVRDSRLLDVNAGGCGTIVASLANLLGWQIYRRESGPDSVFFRRFTAVNFAFLAGMGTLGGLLGIT